MDSKNSTTLGFVLIGLVLIVWFTLMSKQPAKPVQKPTTADTSHVVDSSRMAAPSAESTSAQAALQSPAANPQSLSTVFRPDTSLAQSTKTIETPLFTATIDSRGAAISSFILKKYKTWDHKPLDLVNHQDYRGGDIDLKFVASDGKTVATNALPFVLDPKSLAIGDSDSISFSAVYHLDSGRTIEKIFHITGSKYLIGIDYKLVGLQTAISGYHYTASLDNPLPYEEKLNSTETANAKAFAGVAGELEDLTVTKAGALMTKPVNGDITYAGMRNQYFEQAVIPTGTKAIASELSGIGMQAPDGGVIAKYSASIDIPIGHTPTETLSFNLYFGPLEYERVSALGVGLEQSMNFGWSFVVRPISIYLMMPLFLWLHGFIANWGLVIIVFSILIKLITVPLSTGQMRSMRKMQVLQPEVTKLRDKYKEDPKKMNEELMKLYKTYGVNPAGGCLPMVLQMPILFALYAVLRNVIQLRQAPFGLWISDLSVPDALFHFGTKLPLLGEQMSGLTLLLVITMFVQQLFTVTDPRQKSMAYIMPIVFIFMFNNLPSGVGLYYFMFNIFGLAQQFYLTKIATPPSLEAMKSDPKKSKGGGLMGRLQAMEQQQREVRKQQYAGKGLPGGKKK
ncbi:MAG TPA: membrane protein insertase YidC [Candidatus Kapabacteria bacterium]|jgi:YidC/Oxa1 family membrane protein insertase|nr:membrane protein insertase YidC [Candidatus Kapabacteria bacterium]